MCAQFIIGRTGQQLGRQLKAKVTDGQWNLKRIVPRQPAPVLIKEGEEKILRPMLFGLIPSWSREPKVKFSTHNARLFSEDPKTHESVPIYQKPTWKGPFAQRHYVVPMDEFIEPIYTGEWAGNMVRFHPAKGELLCAAGLWENWVSPSTGELLQSFTILTDDPDAHIQKIGHDRTPVFLEDKNWETWLNASAQSSGEWISFLRENKASIAWTEKQDRPLAAGWQKRIPKD